MHKIIKSFSLMLLTGMLSTLSYASNSLEDQLLSSLELRINDAGEIERNGSYGQAIQNYMREGFINNRPDLYRSDYVDYYIVKNPTTILGQELKVIEEEYMSEYVGCCVSEGVGMLLKTTNDTTALDNFAQKNRCSIEPIDYSDYFEYRGLSMTSRERGTYAVLSCRQRDIENFN